MEDIFEGGFYGDTLFSGGFVEEGFHLENRPNLGTAGELPFNSFVKYKDGDFPTSASTTQSHEMASYSCTEMPKGMPQSGKTTGPLEEMDGICFKGNATNNTWNVNVAHAEARTGNARGQPLKKIRRLRANDRERRRMRSLNRALESLKKCLPVPQNKRRVTKLEILRIACNYIRSLSDTLSEDCRSSDGPSRGKKSRARGIVSDPVVNGFSVAQRLEILSGNNTNRI